MKPAQFVFGALGVDIFPIVFEHDGDFGNGIWLGTIGAKVNKIGQSAKECGN